MPSQQMLTAYPIQYVPPQYAPPQYAPPPYYSPYMFSESLMSASNINSLPPAEISVLTMEEFLQKLDKDKEIMVILYNLLMHLRNKK